VKLSRRCDQGYGDSVGCVRIDPGPERPPCDTCDGQ